MLKNTSLPGRSKGEEIEKTFTVTEVRKTQCNTTIRSIKLAYFCVVPTSSTWMPAHRGPLVAQPIVSLCKRFIEQSRRKDTTPEQKKMQQRFFHLLNVGNSAEMMFLLLLICGQTATAGNTRSLIVQYILALRLYHASTPHCVVALPHVHMNGQLSEL